MEADAYERISSALTNRNRRTNLPINSPCGIEKIVWSVWDYIVGPELRFVWDIVPSELDQLTAPLADSESDAASTASARSATSDLRSQTSGGEFITHYHDSSLDPMSGDESGSNRVIVEIHACGRCLKSDCDGGENCMVSSMSEFVDRALKLVDEHDRVKIVDGESKTDVSPQMSNSNSSPGDPLQSSQSTIVDSETSDSLADITNAPLANLK
jgi:hypothetical protein